MRSLSIISVLILTGFLSLSLAGGEGEEAAPNVGADKGVVEVNERLGFKLSPEALKNFEVKSMKLSGDGPWEIPRSAIVTSGEETNLYRIRSGFFKRIDFEVIRALPNKAVIADSNDMREGDEIVSHGVGFLRISELSLEGGLSHSH